MYCNHKGNGKVRLRFSLSSSVLVLIFSLFMSFAMKKPDKPFTKAPAQKSQDSKLPVNPDQPIIHHEDPEVTDDVQTFTDLPEKIHATNGFESEDVTTAVYYKDLKVTSGAFENNGPITSKYTCDGANINPPLNIEGVPPEAKCLALIVDDPDAPGGTFVHWLVWNIPVTHHIKENEIHGVQGLNDYKKNQYKGPCPPSGVHHYYFKVYALNVLLDLQSDTRKEQLEKAMGKHIIAFGQLIGTYQRSR